MRSRTLVAAVALGTSLTFLSGCAATKYRLSPKNDTVILVPEAASASVKGRFDNSELAWYWRPSEMWGESPYSYVSDVLGRTASNKSVTNVRVRLDKNGFIQTSKNTLGWVVGGLFFLNQVGAAWTSAGQEAQAAVTSFDFSRIASAAGGVGVAVVVGAVGWNLIQWAADYLIPDLYGIGVEGDYVDPPVNLGKGDGGKMNTSAPVPKADVAPASAPAPAPAISK